MTRFLIVMMVLLVPLNLPAQSEETPVWRWSFQQRTRFVVYDNTIGLNADADAGNTFTRHRNQAQIVWSPNSSFSAGIRLANEFRYYFKPDVDFNLHEILIDNLYVRLTRPYQLPFSLWVGRQNLVFGEGFLLSDGTSADGSRTSYFNSVLMDIHLGDRKRLSAFYVDQRVRDKALPVLNDQEKRLLEQPERAMGLYYSGTHGKTLLEGYYIRKEAEKSSLFAENTVNTAGARFRLPATPALSITAEAAGQFGSAGGNDLSAFGGYARLVYNMDGSFPRPSALILQTVVLSGDDPGTSRVEAWDPLFSRYPKWSDSFIYALIPETGGRCSYWTNFISLNGNLQFRLADHIMAEFIFLRLLAVHPRAGTDEFPSGGGTNRGNLLITRLHWRPSGRFQTRLIWEYFMPGDYYGAEADPYHWMQLQMILNLTNATEG